MVEVEPAKRGKKKRSNSKKSVSPPFFKMVALRGKVNIASNTCAGYLYGFLSSFQQDEGSDASEIKATDRRRRRSTRLSSMASESSVEVGRRRRRTMSGQAKVERELVFEG